MPKKLYVHRCPLGYPPYPTPIESGKIDLVQVENKSYTYVTWATMRERIGVHTESWKYVKTALAKIH